MRTREVRRVLGVTLRDDTARALHLIVADKQRKDRVPGIFAGVVRGGGLLWHDGVGAASLDEPDTPPDRDDQFLIASNTKTFTATMVMALRDEGRLSLDDSLDAHVPEVTQPALTLRQCLAHLSGIQREPVGDVWETLVFPDREQLLAGFNQAERVHPPHRFWHYSNLAYSMLGEVVARLDGRDWAESLRARILNPLEMRRTTVGFSGAHAEGYYVPPYTDVPVPQPANRPPRHGSVRWPGQHRGRPRAVVRVRRRPGCRGALSRHARGDVRAAGADRP